ncbi:MAG: class I SAM-dependent methyltransferase [Planctomycetes bacterium]|nr:class I SAM-dependent methyltransferase [Planctomycetota bacterium]
MPWDPTWEAVFAARDWGRYPPEELVRFAARRYPPGAGRKGVSVLELGCGAGANLWFLAREGFAVSGLDGSASALVRAERRLREDGLSAELRRVDASDLAVAFPAEAFDAVVDVACLQHNDPASARSILSQVSVVLKPGGRVFSMLVARGSHGDPARAASIPSTESAAGPAPTEGKGYCRFASLEDVKALFEAFAAVEIEYSVRSLQGRKRWYKQWVVEATKG